jgi:MinD-like ATPase involved in chromosome partitioning or flagellar assembly
MQTITFYSYKGGTGRSLALANAAVYLARLGFSVVALDFDLEAPGLHYKFSRNDDGTPLAVTKGVVDYVNAFILDGRVPSPLQDFVINAPVPGVEKPLVHLMPAGQAPSSDYWLKLSRIDWHNLFYSKGAKGVQVFMELKTQILDEFAPDYLLIDARTGITEMGGVATTILADKVICLVLPTVENLAGARAVLQSLKRSRRDSGAPDLEIMVAVSRLPEMKGSEDEREETDRILAEMNQEAADLKDTLSCHSAFVLHSEAALQVREMLRVGSGMDPDESVLLRDYLRLFATFVPKEAIEPKVHDLIEKAWEKLRHDPDAAVKDMEEYAESFGHPETYRELLRFYQVRNVAAVSILRRAQRLWEITRDSKDPYLWEVLSRYFEPTPTYPRKRDEWCPSLDFMRELWRDAGRRDPKFGMKLAEQYNTEDIESGAADILLEIINSSDPSSRVVIFCIQMLDIAKRIEEADGIIARYKARLGNDPDFATSWARHALRTNNKGAASEITKLPAISTLRPFLAGLLYSRVGSTEQAAALADQILVELSERDVPTRDLDELGLLFRELGRADEFEKAITRGYPADVIQNLRDRPRRIRRR